MSKQSNRIFGMGLRNLRRAALYSLDDVAQKTGLSKGLLSKIENGGGNPTLETMGKLLLAFGGRDLPELVADIWKYSKGIPNTCETVKKFYFRGERHSTD